MRRVLFLGAIAMLLAYTVMAYHFWDQVRNGYSDFISFYTAGQILQRDEAEKLYDLNLQYEIQREHAPGVNIRAGALPFVRPPFEAWLFLPLAKLDYFSAFLLWDLLTIALLIATSVMARSHIPGLNGVPAILTVLAMFSYYPVFLTLLQGQDSVVLLLVFFLTYVTLRAQRELTGGLVLGLGIFKFPLVIPFLIPFFVAKRIRLLAGFCITSLVLAGISLWTTGVRSLSEYPGYLLAVDKFARGVNDPRDMPNLRGLLSVILGHSVSPGVLKIVIAVVSLLLVGWLATKYHAFVPGESTLFSLAFSLDVIVTMLVSYHAHVFDLVLLLPFLGISLGMVMSQDSLPPQSRRLLGLAAGCILFSPLYVVLTLLSPYTTVFALILLGTSFVLFRAISGLEDSTSLQEQSSALPTHSH